MWNKDKKIYIMEAGKTSFFAEGLKLNGDVVSDNDVRVDGVIYGNVSTTKKVIVGREGYIFGNVKALNLLVMGDITGEIVVSELVEIESTGSINGKLFFKNLQIDRGALIEATLKRLKKSSFEIDDESITSKYGDSIKVVEL